MKNRLIKLALVTGVTLISIVHFVACDSSKSDTKSATKAPTCILYPQAYRIPIDANLTKVIDHSDTVLLQHIADTVSWKTFVALNWPALDNGLADSNKCIGDYEKSVTVWEKWTEINQIISKVGVPIVQGKEDTVWIPKVCVDKYQKYPDKKDLLILYKNTVPGSKNGINKKGYQLIDQNSNPTYYQIYYNPSMVDYIKKGQLNTLSGQKNFVKTWPQLTEGIKVFDNESPVPFESIFFSIDVREDSVVQKLNYKMVFHRNTTGAMMLKTAWKILAKNDDTSKFYTREALVAISKDSAAICKVALVGMHIAHKTAESPQWIWSTFEHVNNVPERGVNGTPIVQKDVKYTFFNPACNTCKINTPDTSFPASPSQIVREIPISPDVKSLNILFQKQMQTANSKNVWQYYDLVGTQWPFSPSLLSTILVPAYPLQNGNPRPHGLANTTMESYDQKTSCMSCHANAFVLNKIPSDFVWGLIKTKK